MSEERNTQRKRARGVVKSDKMDKTVTVTLERLTKDLRYQKYVRRKKSFAVHDPHNEAREGDLVEIESTRPLSRRKRWRLVRILTRSSEALAGAPTPQPEPDAGTEAAV